MRGVVQVTLDAASSPHHRQRLVQIDVDGGVRTQIAGEHEPQDPPATITVGVSSPGLHPATVDIPLSTDRDRDSVLAAAATAGNAPLLWHAGS